MASIALGSSIYDADYNEPDYSNDYSSSDDNYYDYASTPDQYDNDTHEAESNYAPDYRYFIEPPTID